MKKVSLFFAMIFAVSMAMGQNNDATITQVGDSHEAIISQGGDLNAAYVLQTADDGREAEDLGEAFITQQGNDNLVRLNQRAFYGDASADVLMVGNRNKMHGKDDTKDFWQNHGLNIVEVEMVGDDNILYSFDGEAQKNVNTLKLNVLGSRNETGLFQHFGIGEVDITGSDNDVQLRQRSGIPGNETEINFADIDIAGDWNEVLVNQNDLNNSAVVDITGSWNDATIIQTGGVVYP